MTSLELILTQDNAIVREGIDITIPAIVYEARRRGARSPHTLFLNHQEPPVAIVGNMQPRNDDEVRRPDPGGIYFHGNGSSRCFMTTYPAPQSKTGKLYDNTFVKEITQHIHKHYPDAAIVKGDLESEDKRLISLSHAYKAPSWMVRACWYEEPPDANVLERMRRSGKSSQEHLARIQPLPRLYETLKSLHQPRQVEPYEFVSQESIHNALQLQYRAGTTNKRDACVTRT